MNKDFPCKVCTHPAYKHWVNVSKDDNVCTDCVERDRSHMDFSEGRHEFVGDNFKYLELLNKREELQNE
jgi:hypothetical protein